MTHNSQCIHGYTGRHGHPHSRCCSYVQESSKVNHTPLPLLTYSQIPTFLHTYLSISQVAHSHTHTNMHSHKHSHTVVHADSHRHTHTAPNTSRAYFISNCEKMLLVFINLQTLCLPISLASLSLFPTLSLSARRQVSASIFSSSVAVKLNGIGLIAENQREG